MVMAQALFRRLRENARDAIVDVLAPGWSLPLLARMPEVHEAVELDVGHGELAIRKRRRLGIALRGKGYDQAIVLPRSFKSALVPAFARIAKRTGFLGEYRYGLINDIRPFDRQRLNQTVKRFVSLAAKDETLADIPRPELIVYRDRVRQLREQFGLAPDGRHVVLAPGAEYGPAKRWPAQYFAEVAKRCAANDFDVLIIGSAKEAAIGADIEAQAASTGIANLCGRTELADAIDLLGSARAAICNDSGLMHVAAAAGAPLVALYGSSSPDFTPPLSPHARVLYRSLECSPCFRRECPLGHLDCLRGIEPDQVISELDALLAQFTAA